MLKFISVQFLSNCFWNFLHEIPTQSWFLFLFSSEFVKLDELAEFNLTQSNMTEGYWKIFCLSLSEFTP